MATSTSIPTSRCSARSARSTLRVLITASIDARLTLRTIVLTGHRVLLRGTLMADQPAGATVTFSGAASGSATTDEHGNFSYTTAAALGTVYAVAALPNEQFTNTSAL